MKLVYFAWVRERIGLEEETVDLPQSVKSTTDLLGWLRQRGPQYAHALPEDNTIRIAIDRVHAPHDTPLANAREVALFPPMTGG